MVVRCRWASGGFLCVLVPYKALPRELSGFLATLYHSIAYLHQLLCWSAQS